jgi:hypothetical protein
MINEYFMKPNIKDDNLQLFVLSTHSQTVLQATNWTNLKYENILLSPSLQTHNKCEIFRDLEKKIVSWMWTPKFCLQLLTVWKLPFIPLLNKNRMIDNVQKVNNCLNMLSQTFRYIQIPIISLHLRKSIYARETYYEMFII